MTTRGLIRFLSWLFLASFLIRPGVCFAQPPSSPTGISLPAKGKRIPLDSLVELQTYNTGPLLSFPAHPNVHPAGVPKVIPIPSELPVFTPGQGGLRKPRKVKAEGVSVPALQPKPVPALPMHMRENARYDILWMDADQGLSANSITSILEDSRGHLWFVAGDDGVIRYDGKRFTTFTAKEGLGTPGLYTILEDSKGNIWFGGIQGKVCRYDGRSFTHYGLDSVSTILCITEDKRGNIWFGTTHGGAVCYDGANFAYYSTAQGLSGYNVQAILEDSRGDIWLGTSNGLNRFDGMRFTRYTKSDGLISPLVLSIAEDNQGNLWFGSHLGVSCFDGKRFAQFTTEEGLAHNYVRRILKDSQGNIWFTSLQGGISRFDGATFTHYTTKEGLPNNSANGIWEDSGGNIWITAGGVSRLNPHSFVHFMEIDGKKTGGVQSLLKDQDGNIWFFKDNGERLVKYDGQFFSLPAYDNNFRPHYSLGEEMMEDYHGGLWFASQFASHYDGDIFTLYGAKSRDSRFQKFRCVLEGQQGNIWFGGVNGAFRFDGERMWQYDEKDGLPPSTIMSMLLDRHGKLWIGSESGITKYDGKNFTNYYDAESWGNFWAKTILEDSQSTLWFGGKQGVMRYDRKQATFYSTEDGLSHFYVNSIVEGQHQEMWIGTRQGLTLMVPNRTKVGSDSFPNKPSYRFYTFGKGDGLNEIFIFKAILGRHNRLWLGTAKGLSMLDLNQFELASKPPRILLEHIEANQQFIDYRQLADSAYLHSLAFGPALARSFDSIVPFFNYPVHPKLPHYLNDLAFHFSGIDWAAPHKIEYQYYLEGLEKDWNPPANENKVEYRNLPFGIFTFKVRAKGESQEWSDPVEYTFTIRPPWYRTNLAYVLWTALLLSALYGIYRFQLSRQMAQAEALRLKELDTVKNRLYANITHEFRTPLTVINGIAELLEAGPDSYRGQSAVEQPEKMSISEGLKMIRRQGRNLLRLVNQMLDLSRLESGKLKVNLRQGNVVAFLKYLLESFHSMAESNNISLHFQSLEETLVMDFDPEKLQQIVGNLLSNAIKFTPEGGKVSVTVEKTPGVLTVTVTDTGRGIPADQLDKIFSRFHQVDDSATRSGEGTGIGLTLAKELVKLLGGKISVESELGKGSVFTVVLPVTNNADILDAGDTIDAVDALDSQSTGSAVSAIAPAERVSSQRPGLLIIEDNTDVVHYLASILQHSYLLLTAPNGKAGLEKAQQENPDIILCDVMMPEMDGYEVCRRLKGDLETSHIPVILLTARADFESRMEGLEGGADAYLAKPFEERELKIQLKKLLENRERLRQFYTSGAFINQAGSTPTTLAQSTPQEQEFFRQLLSHIEAHLSDPAFSAENLSDLLFMSYSTCLRKVKAATGMTVNDYIRHVRMHRAARWLREAPERAVASIGLEVGYKSNAYFSREFRKVMGFSPKEYREQ